MQVHRDGRILRITGLPDRTEGIKVPTELEIEINQTDSKGSPNRNAICLDNVVLPLIVKALEAMETMAQTEAKLSHGCYGFYCQECDGPREK